MQKYTFQKKAAADDRGFYIILAVCLAAIVVSGYVLFTVPSGSNPEGASADANLDSGEYVPTVETVEPVTDIVEEPSADVPVAPVVKETPPETQTPDKPKTPETALPVKTIWVRPAKGEVTIPFSGDELLFQPTFCDWRVHRGTDYAGSTGDRVYAITNGTVKTVWSDSLEGNCVTITHADGVTATYKGLMDKVKVKAGDTVKSGDVIGAIGETNISESAQGPHLHLEAMKDEVYIDAETLYGDTQGE